MKLNGTYQLLEYADDVNTVGWSVHITKKNAESLLVANKEIGLEVNADKTKYMAMSQDRNAKKKKIHNIKIDNKHLKGWNSSDIWEQS
jgi:hypothetical protein